MFSIIIPLYNKTDNTEKAMRSEFNQTFQEFELIVINDVYHLLFFHYKNIERVYS